MKELMKVCGFMLGCWSIAGILIACMWGICIIVDNYFGMTGIACIPVVGIFVAGVSIMALFMADDKLQKIGKDED